MFFRLYIDSCAFSVLLFHCVLFLFQFMLVCGCGSQGAVVGAYVGVGLSVTEHTAQHDGPMDVSRTSSRVFFVCFWYFSIFLAVWLFLEKIWFVPFVGESQSMRTLLIV